MSELDEGLIQPESSAISPPVPPSTMAISHDDEPTDLVDSSTGGNAGSTAEGHKTVQVTEATTQIPLSTEINRAPTGPPLVDANGDVDGSSPTGAYGSSVSSEPTGLLAVSSASSALSHESSISDPNSDFPSWVDAAPPAGTAPTAELIHGSPSSVSGQAVPPSVPNTGWTARGETPTGPPAQLGFSQSSPKYLPPVDPPGSVIPPKSARSESGKSRWGWRALTSFVAGGLIAAAGFGAAQFSATESSEEATASATAGATSEITTTAAPLLPPVDVDEPAAYVATLVGPAVVQVETDFGLGSGVIYDDGLILTNEHVVEGATMLRIRLSDGRFLPAELVGSDSNTDIAVLSVEKGLDLPIAAMATGEKATVGQLAIAIGSPFKLQQTVTSGIVSAVDRPLLIGNQRVVAMIQTDAPINPGNSGGALVDKEGRVIGINTSIQTDGTTSTNAGVGFAVPIDTARRIADLLVSGEPIESGFLGVTGQPPQGGEAGVEIAEVTVDSAADIADVRVGDRVLSLDGAPVTQLEELAGLVLAKQAGDVVELEVVRSGETIIIDVTLGIREG